MMKPETTMARVGGLIVARHDHVETLRQRLNGEQHDHTNNKQKVDCRREQAKTRLLGDECESDRREQQIDNTTTTRTNARMVIQLENYGLDLEYNNKMSDYNSSNNIASRQSTRINTPKNIINNFSHLLIWPNTMKTTTKLAPLATTIPLLLLLCFLLLASAPINGGGFGQVSAQGQDDPFASNQDNSATIESQIAQSFEPTRRKTPTSAHNIDDKLASKLPESQTLQHRSGQATPSSLIDVNTGSSGGLQADYSDTLESPLNTNNKQPTESDQVVIQPANNQELSAVASVNSDNSLPGQSSHPHEQLEKKAFRRINELESFLDEMNHNELRDVAAGRPIDNELFKPKALAATESGQSMHGRQPESSSPASSRSLIDVGGKPGGSHLDTAQSTERSSYSDCALILQRTYVKNSVEDPKHHPLMGLPFGRTEQACIGYKHINKAIEQAKHKLKFRELAKAKKKRQPGGPEVDPLHNSLEPPSDLIAALGEINMATTQILADQFDLSNDELLNGLPLIDMSKTNFWPMCPLLVRQDLKCELSRFRTLTGHCNNLKHPTWGAAMTPFARYLPPIHPDGIWTPRKSIVSEMTFHLSGEQPHVAASSMVTDVNQPVVTRQRRSGDARKRAQPETRIRDENDEMPAASVQRASFAIQHHDALASRRHHVHSASPVGPSGENLIDTHYERLHSEGRVFDAASGPSPIINVAHSNDIDSDQGPEPRIGGHHALAHHHAPSRRSTPAELPPVRLISTVVHHDVDMPNHDFSILFMSWGQLLDHDMTRAAQPPSTIKCCGPEEMGQPKHKLCLPIKVPEQDPFYSKFNVQCLEFRRSLAGLRPNCVLGPRVHQNAITSPIDANFVYGSSRSESDALRLFRGGRLRDRDWFKHQQLKPLLPAQEEEPDQDCLGRPKDLFCFLAGDVRANEQIHLTVLHTLYMREHNRIADRLAELNPHWNDERLFQETRHIMAAGVQQVMINEYIPLLIGKKMATLYNLTGQAHSHSHGDALHHHHHLHQMIPHVEHSDGNRRHGHSLGEPHVVSGSSGAYWHGYDPSVTTSVSNSFAAAAFRQGHTFIQGTVERYNKFHEFIGSEKLRHLFKQPFILYQPGALDELTSGLINQPAQSYDPFISTEIAGHLFQPPERQFGHDLASINLQRGREQGLPGYNLWREWCGLPRAETFEQLAPFLTNHTAFLYSRLYKHVDDIDLWSGGISERKLPGAAIGPTFACIIARQFSNTRRGDRFWFENPGLPSSFTPEQLAQIRKISLSKILCANSDDLPTIQRWALRMPHPVLNQRIACNQLPEIDLRFWQEDEQ